MKAYKKDKYKKEENMKFKVTNKNLIKNKRLKD